MKTVKKHNNRNDISGVSATEFSAAVDKLFPENTLPEKIAVGVSGGADSTALALLLADYAKETGRQLTALTVNHNLRSASAEEADQAVQALKKHGISCHILDWQPTAQKTAVQKRARDARYRLMTKYCRDHGISVLFLAHHADDQAETFWMRLNAGSGIDGLACMEKLRREPESSVLIARPLLDFDKDDLETVCTNHKTGWIEDPSNTAPQYLRSHIRKALAQMPSEKVKILQTVALFGRLREKLRRETAAATLDCAIFYPEGYAALHREAWQAYPAEIRRRILQNIVQDLAGKPYPPRTRTLDNAMERLVNIPDHGVFTFGSCIFERRGNTVFISRETAAIPPENITKAAFMFGRCFHIQLPFLSETPLFCNVLGTRGLSFLPAAQRKAFAKQYKALPRFARQALPVLESAEGIVAVPHLAWADSAVFGENPSISVRFQPPEAIFDEDIEIV
ncbi:MAG: tRNA lysidine(34) synthetase TilS [Alphaproteobacteria bacterium]|nr:MAG: tRNA lysidine(34) synthetase TilS [Alphaproteobacteria bacterium]